MFFLEEWLYLQMVLISTKKCYFTVGSHQNCLCDTILMSTLFLRGKTENSYSLTLLHTIWSYVSDDWQNPKVRLTSLRDIFDLPLITVNKALVSSRTNPQTEQQAYFLSILHSSCN